MDSCLDGSVVLLDARYWGEHALQLASLLQRGLRGAIADPKGRHPDLVATIADPEYWSHHVSELSDALLDRNPDAPRRMQVASALSSSSSDGARGRRGVSGG